MMFEEQVSINWPGLAKETVELCKKLEIEDVHTISKTKSAYAKELRRTCLAMEDSMMKTESSNMLKMSKISAEDWGLKEYMKSGSSKVTHINVLHIKKIIEAVLLYVLKGAFPASL